MRRRLPIRDPYMHTRPMHIHTYIHIHTYTPCTRDVRSISACPCARDSPNRHCISTGFQFLFLNSRIWVCRTSRSRETRRLLLLRSGREPLGGELDDRRFVWLQSLLICNFYLANLAETASNSLTLECCCIMLRAWMRGPDQHQALV